MNMSIQALALDRIRYSLGMMGRESGFTGTQMQSFNSLPLYIPEYQRWSMSLNRIVGTRPPEMPRTIPGALDPGFRREASTALSKGRSGVESFVSAPVFQKSWDTIAGEVDPWKKWANTWLAWDTSQKNLPK
jgi:hypothetical protein